MEVCMYHSGIRMSGENGTIMMKTEKVFEMELQKLMAKNISLVQEYCM